jgi:hypothetical protein
MNQQQPPEERWGRRDGTGPVHASSRGPWGQAWCGSRPQFPHDRLPQETPVTCPKCLRAIKRGHPFARGGR